MRSQKGITLLSVIVYVVALVIVAGTVTSITAFFYSNTDDISKTANSLGEFNKFNLEMVSETKQPGNRISYIQDDGKRIIFTSGSSFTFQDNGIYKDRVKICTEITNCQFKQTVKEEKVILVVLFEMDGFAKTIEYVMDNIAPVNTNIEENYTQISEEKYIQDGLQLHYDAINNTGDGHSSTTTTWRDLSKNHNDGILSNVTWDEKSAVFNGTSSWVNCGIQNSDYQTLVTTFSLTSIGSTYTVLIGNYETSGGAIYVNTGRKLGGEFFVDGSYRTATSNITINIGEIHQAVAMYDGKKVQVYLDGEKIQEATYLYGTIEPAANSTVMALGTNPNGNQASTNFLSGKIYSAAVYDRALTDEEILHNFQIDKDKYGI